MKKMHFMLISVIVSVFLFASCDFTDDPFDFTDDPFEGDIKNLTTIVVWPVENSSEDNPIDTSPSDNATVSVSGLSSGQIKSYYSYGGGYSYERTESTHFIIMLTLSEGSWNSFTHYWSTERPKVNAFSKWVNIEPQRLLYEYGTVEPIGTKEPFFIVESGYEYIKVGNFYEKRANPQVLSFVGHSGWNIFKQTVTLNEEKLSEMKDATNITDNLTIGIKSVVLGYQQDETTFVEKYGLSFGFIGIWNDYMMPGWGWQLTPEGERASICTVQIGSLLKLPSMKVSAKIITDRVTLSRELSCIYGQGWDFRPVNGFRLNNGEEYTIEITLKIPGEQQTFIFRNIGKVDVTS